MLPRLYGLGHGCFVWSQVEVRVDPRSPVRGFHHHMCGGKMVKKTVVESTESIRAYESSLSHSELETMTARDRDDRGLERKTQERREMTKTKEHASISNSSAQTLSCEQQTIFRASHSSTPFQTECGLPEGE